MQDLVEGIADYYIDSMLNCKCPRCVADMKAFALSNLPSKYVVFTPTQKNAYMSLYASRYDRVLSTQLMRACVRINEEPHH